MSPRPATHSSAYRQGGAGELDIAAWERSVAGFRPEWPA